MNSVPQSKLIDRRAEWGRGPSTSIKPSMIAGDCRSLLRKKTVKRLTRSTREVTFPSSSYLAERDHIAFPVSELLAIPNDDRAAKCFRAGRRP